jgi:hypothetical protein
MVLAFLFAFWQTSWVIPQVVPALFGTGGGLITLFFLASAWQWASIRPALSGSAKTGADLSILGLVFFVVAAWNLCGVFGIGNYVLRPELADKFSVPLGSTINMASRVLVLFVVGWGFTFFGQWKTREAYAIEQSPAGSYPAVGDRLVDPVKP